MQHAQTWNDYITHTMKCYTNIHNDLGYYNPIKIGYYNMVLKETSITQHYSVLLYYSVDVHCSPSSFISKLLMQRNQDTVVADNKDDASLKKVLVAQPQEMQDPCN